MSAIYRGKGWDVINDPLLGSCVAEELIDAHKRVVCLGRGSPAGLYGGRDFLIHDSLAALLREKEMISIWCHADKFMDRYGLKGFYSGMFISEPGEAYLCGIDNTDEQAVSASNDLFASVLGKHIDADNILEQVKSGYLRAGDPVIAYNHRRLYYRSEIM